MVSCFHLGHFKKYRYIKFYCDYQEVIRIRNDEAIVLFNISCFAV